MVTDSITVNATWYRAPARLVLRSQRGQRRVLRRGGVDPARIRALGFPVSRLFAEALKSPVAAPKPGGLKRVLYLINTGKKKAGKAVDRLLETPDLHLTITVGRDAGLKTELLERTANHSSRVEVLGWTNQMPRLMMSSHLIIGKAGGATVQEAIAARTPMIVNQVIPGQEEGNAELVEKYELGAVAEKGREVAELVEKAFAHRARLWEKWKDNLQRVSRPDASLQLARMILSDTDEPGEAAPGLKLFHPPATRVMRPDSTVLPSARPGALAV